MKKEEFSKSISRKVEILQARSLENISDYKKRLSDGYLDLHNAYLRLKKMSLSEQAYQLKQIKALRAKHSRIKDGFSKSYLSFLLSVLGNNNETVKTELDKVQVIAEEDESLKIQPKVIKTRLVKYKAR